MAALGTPVLINPARSYWLSSIGPDVVHSTIVVDQIDANSANISTLFAENITASTMNVSTLNFQNSDVSGMYVSSIRGNTAFFSTLTMASDLSGGLGYVRFSVDASGIQVDGDPIRFDNLVYLTSTINIIQVSTLVDTDIFASNGYFSSLSSGNFTAGASQISSAIVGDLSGTNGSFDRLFVSSLEALDISGVAPSTWSLYPTLNSSITFQPGFVLSNINNTLWFAGNELTDASGGGQDWSIFPAFSTVQMANNSIGQLSTLGFQDGGRLASVTGNNLLYNGSNISYGPGGFASNWAQYPANCNVNMGSNTLFNVAQINGSNLALNGSNITNGNTFTNSLGVGGTSILSLATINSSGQGVLQDLDVGNTTTAIGDLNVYGNFAAPGDNALYVIGGTTLTGGLTAGVPVHGTEIGALPVAGVDTVRIDVLPVGMGLNSATYIQLAAAGAGSFAAGGALSLAGGNYVEINTDDCRIINTTSGNQSTTLTVANIQMPASVAASVPLQINNTAGGGINLVGSSGVGQIAGFSSIAGNAVTAQSSFTTTSLINFSQVSTFLMGFGLILSTTIADLRANNIKVADDITGVTNAPMPLESRIVNFSSIQSGTMSTTNLVVSTINGLPWDISGNDPLNNNYSTLTASSFRVSTMTGYAGDPILGSTIFVEGGLNFVGDPPSDPSNGGRHLTNLRNIFSLQQNLFIQASTTTMTWSGGVNPEGFVRIGKGGAYDSYFKQGPTSEPILSTSAVYTSSLVGHPIAGMDVSGYLGVTGDLAVGGNITLTTTKGVEFGNGNVLGNGSIATSAVPCFTDGGAFGNNLGGVAANAFFIGSGTGAFGAAKLYCDFPGDNWGVDIIDANGTDLFETINCYDTGGFNFQTNVYGVSSIVGWTANSPGAQQAVGVQGILTANQVSTTAVKYTSTLNWYGSNTAYNFPLVLEHDAAGNLSTSGAAIRIIGHSFQNGNAQHELQMGWRSSDAANYITALWAGQNLEDLVIEGEPVIITDGVISTVFNTQPFAIQSQQAAMFGGQTTISTGIVSTPSLLVSSINGNDPNPAFTNNIMTSTMDLYAASTTLVYWDSTSTSSNINTSNYDVIAGVNGTYKIGVSLQFNNTSGTDLVEFFFLKNDNVISQAGGIINVQNNVESLDYCEIIEPLVNGDKIQVGLYTNASDVKLSTINGDILQSPAAILTMYKIN